MKRNKSPDAEKQRRFNELLREAKGAWLDNVGHDTKHKGAPE